MATVSLAFTDDIDDIDDINDINDTDGFLRFLHAVDGLGQLL
ncbi:hypothetical protein SAMN05192546_106152 [Tindallia californiensis]|uniref:Uncharacterized protein n=1 Tax=Tindallia californiensis TaxID=159292 RepID=A0A1H3PDS8_9FIRM|nr:hypothetical protein SAMN05192546_106152 [Tindallia californiensis]